MYSAVVRPACSLASVILRCRPMSICAQRFFFSAMVVALLSVDCKASILERHGESYYQYHQGTADRPSISTNLNS